MQRINWEISGAEAGDKVGLLAPRVSTQRAADARRSRSGFLPNIYQKFPGTMGIFICHPARVPPLIAPATSLLLDGAVSWVAG
jgi:hypothetical protein